MAKRNRETLKNYFRAGKRPTEQQFEDLIDSALNALDDGFSGSLKNGMGLTPLSETGNVLSVYPNAGAEQPLWEIGLSQNNELEFKSREKPVCVLKRQSEDENAPDVPVVDIQGRLCSVGRKGTYRTGRVPADGRWHDILGDEQYLNEKGCRAFEVMAGCGEKEKGRYALLWATVMHCFGEHPQIHQTRSHFGIFGNKLCLRWVKEKDFACRLQIKTFFKYGNGSEIRYQITDLWDNPAMND